MTTGKRYTLDIAHLVGDTVIRRHIVCLTYTRAKELEYVERAQPGAVYSEINDYVPGDPTWTIEYRNRDAARPEDLVA